MLSIIVDTGKAEDRLAGLFVQLTTASVEGLVREVLVTGPAWSELVAEAMDGLCEDVGAELAGDLRQAIGRAKSELLLVLPAEIRLREGWVDRLKVHLAGGRRGAILEGTKAASLFALRPYGVLIAKAEAAGLVEPDLKRLRRQLGGRADRLD